ncbi:MAG: hypothetical protein CMH22_06070 [Methylophaga sp.]|nr:hypothetical protein [Methylophaga sp.]|tara:strand:+ start:55411 stop:55905 length:495 start_codon:yes stop_codon:yes gene_type:complete
MYYFSNCKDLNDAKTLFRKLCHTLHPDKGGNAQEFIKMQAEFKTVSNKLKFNTGYETDKDFNASKFYDLVRKFDGLSDINISFVGSFIWLEDIKRGAMYEQKDAIKAINLDGYNNARFARKKISWYFSPKDYKQKYSKGKTLDQIKATYGSQEYKTKQTARIKA